MKRRSGPLPETITVPEAARVLGISRDTAYTLARTGELPTIRLGKRIVVSRRVIDRMLSGSAA